MATFRIQHFFNQHSRGFSELWYFQSSTMTSLLEELQFFFPLRAELLARDVVWQSIRITQLDGDNPTSRKLTYCQDFPNSGLAGDVTASGALIRMSTNGRNVRAMIMRGFPDAYIIREASQNALVMSAAGRVALDAYLEQWRSVGVYIRARPRLTVAVPGTQITDLTSGNVTGSILNVQHNDDPFVVAAGTKVQIMKIRGRAAGVNGIWPVIARVDASNFTIPFVWARIIGFPATDLKNAVVRLAATQFMRVSGMFRFDVRTRKSGRAYEVPRGRNPNHA